MAERSAPEDSHRAGRDVMTSSIARLKVLFTAFPTYAQIASVALAAALVELEPYSGVPYVGVVLKWGGIAAGVLAAAWRVVRRVSEVPESERGLLPPVAVPEPWD